MGRPAGAEPAAGGGAPIEVCYAVNEDFVQHLCVSLASLLEAHPRRRLRVHVLHDGIAPGRLASVSATARPFATEVCFHVVDETRFASLATGFHFAPANYYRLLIPELLADLERVLYLDADTVVLDDLGAIYDRGAAPHAFAAVEVPGADHRIRGLPRSAGYFNSGVLLIEVAAWLAAGLGRRAIEFAEAHPEQILWVDQCALNAVAAGHWRRLPLRYNAVTPFFLRKEQRRFARLEGFAEAVREPAVLHFTTQSKPWQFMNCHPLRHHYWRFLARTPYADYRAPGGGAWNHLRRLLRRRKYSATVR